MNIFERMNEWLDRNEVLWVNFLTKILPILVPIIPAMQTKKHVVEVLAYDNWQGWIAAVIVEFFGYAAMYKMIQFAEHNRRYAEKNRAPFGIATAIYAAYLTIIIVFNVIPEVEQNKPDYIVWMNGLFAVLSVPAGALTAISALHTERKEAMKRKPNSAPNEQPNSRTPNTPERRTPNEQPNNRTIPLPSNEHPFQIPNTERTRRIEQTARTLEAELKRPPSVREIQQRLRDEDETDSGWSTSTISTALKK